MCLHRIDRFVTLARFEVLEDPLPLTDHLDLEFTVFDVPAEHVAILDFERSAHARRDSYLIAGNPTFAD